LTPPDPPSSRFLRPSANSTVHTVASRAGRVGPDVTTRYLRASASKRIVLPSCASPRLIHGAALSWAQLPTNPAMNNTIPSMTSEIGPRELRRAA
jgi:hypothetical protein